MLHMKAISNFFSGLPGILILALAAFNNIGETQAIAAYDIFEGTSPCTNDTRSFLQIPTSEKCDIVKWRLVLNYDQQGNQPAEYTLTREYIYHIDNSTSKSQGAATIKGRWEILKGIPSLPEAILYRLHNGNASLTFIMVDENLMHLLAPDNSFSAETSVESFTLSRTNGNTAGSSAAMKVSRPLANEKQSMIKFIGRTPCAEIAREIQMPPRADCNKMKWLLKLYLEPSTQQPAGFELSATFHRQSIIKGKWEMLKGRPGDPGAIVYQLHLDKPYQSILLLKGDDNVLFFLDKTLKPLVGNADFSYTLSREK
jgi:hypothetical protein